MQLVAGPARCLPTAGQRLLLAAGLLQDARAVEAWEQWRRSRSLDVVETGEYRLLPLVYRALAERGLRDWLEPRLKGVYRRTWFANQVILHSAGAALRTLEANGVPTLVLKGGALVALHYRDLGVRPMPDVDVLVPTARARSAIDILAKEGWMPPEPIGNATFLVLTACELVGPRGVRLDLHWHVLHESQAPDSDEDFWGAAVPVNVGGVETLALCPADQLLHAIVHGLNWTASDQVRWVADAAVVIRSSGAALDWDRLLCQARSRELALTLTWALRYLREALEVPVPADVMKRLDDSRVTNLERIELACKKRFSPRSLFGAVPALVFRWLRWRRSDSAPEAGVLVFSCGILGARAAWQLPWAFLSKTVPRVAHAPLDLLRNLRDRSRGRFGTFR